MCFKNTQLQQPEKKLVKMSRVRSPTKASAYLHNGDFKRYYFLMLPGGQVRAARAGPVLRAQRFANEKILRGPALAACKEPVQACVQGMFMCIPLKRNSTVQFF